MGCARAVTCARLWNLIMMYRQMARLRVSQMDTCIIIIIIIIIIITIIITVILTVWIINEKFTWNSTTRPQA